MIYQTALYLRISKEDINNENKIESNSISSQRDLLKNYVQNNDELQIFDIYIDDGYSGMDFQRPEFKRMMEDVYAGKINCIIVKDLSRLGRDYIETGNFIQKIFPTYQVRFIAVIDQYDSLFVDNTEENFVLPFKNFLNDSYSRDISMKVRAQQKIKRIQGKCLSAFPVYGYFKNPNNKNQLVTDDYAANIVQIIFLWKIKGMSLGAIAEKLNDFGILSPLEYKTLLGMKYQTGFEGEKTAKWTTVSVKRILTNKIYLGYMEQGKREKVNYKLKKRLVKPEQKWIQVKDTHEAIISKMDFKLVQELMKFDGRASFSTTTANLFCGILFCADCKAPMIQRTNTYKNKKKLFYICQSKNQSLGCTRHSIQKEGLKEILWKEITFWMNLMMDVSKINIIIDKILLNKKQIEPYLTHLESLKKEFETYSYLKESLLPDVQKGVIDKKEFEELFYFYKNKCQELSTIIKKQEIFIEKTKENYQLAELTLNHYKKTKQLENFTRELLVINVQKIYVYENKRMEIVFWFKEK